MRTTRGQDPRVATPELNPPPTEGNSRQTRGIAGWRPHSQRRACWQDLLEARKRNRWGNFTWISPAPLLASMNDLIAKGMDDLVNTIRPRWLAAQRDGGRWTGKGRVGTWKDAEKLSFVLLGDPGEQDASQYAVVAPMLAEAEDTDFMLIASDVIYPAGDINDYIDGFYLPYRKYKNPIYAVPGNHDWYDGLNGFMWHFCDAEALPPVAYRAGSFSWKERLARVLWRKPSPPKLPLLLHEQEQLSDARREATCQPGPYFTIETKHLRIVCIDTGVTGKLDREQGEWLRDVSCDNKPKLLITGKPIYVDGKYHPGDIDWGPPGDAEVEEACREFRTVDDIVRKKEHRYRAVIGGDIHNYQRYSVDVRDREDGAGCDKPKESLRRIEYLVSGGAGAYLSATHRIERVDLKPEVDGKRIPVEPIVEEKNFWCYPLRGDSLARFVRRSSVGFGLTLLASLAVVAIAAVAFFVWPLDGLDQTVQYGDDGGRTELWKAILTVPGAAIVAVLGVLLAVKLSNWAVPFGYRTMTATTLTAAVGALVVWGAAEVFDDSWDQMVWKQSVTTLMAIGIPLLGVVIYFLVRDFIAPAVRVAIALGLPLVLLVVLLVEKEDPFPFPLVLGASLLALWAGVMFVGRLRRVDPTSKTKRLRLGRLLPPILGAAGIVLLLVAMKDTFIPMGLAIALATTVCVLALIVLIVGWRGLLALWAMFPGSIDPDKTAKWLGKRLGVTPTRPSAQNAKVSLKTRALASFLYRTPGLNHLISELAEASRPPFFKHFLHLDADGSTLKITAYGVTGFAADEEAPTVEDRVTVQLRDPAPPAADDGRPAVAETAAAPSQA